VIEGTPMVSGSSPNFVRLDPVDLENVVRHCTYDPSGGRVISTAQAVEELRITTGDFISADKELADALSAKALSLECAVLLDEVVGAGIAIPRAQANNRCRLLTANARGLRAVCPRRQPCQT